MRHHPVRLIALPDTDCCRGFMTNGRKPGTSGSSKVSGRRGGLGKPPTDMVEKPRYRSRHWIAGCARSASDRCTRLYVRRGRPRQPHPRRQVRPRQAGRRRPSRRRGQAGPGDRRQSRQSRARRGVTFPDPDTPVTAVRQRKGIDTETSCRLLRRTPASSKQSSRSRGVRAVLCAPSPNRQRRGTDSAISARPGGGPP